MIHSHAPIDPHAAGLYSRLDADGDARIRWAGRLVFLPIVGWPMVLGYRKALTDHFFAQTDRAMPEWRGRHVEHLWNGVRGIGVIQVYAFPVWVAFVIALHRSEFTPGAATWIGAAICLLVPIFTNIVLPIAILAASQPLRGGPYLEPGTALALSTAFHVLIFLVPAGFVRVSATGRFRSAFRLDRTLPLIRRRFGDYLRAWWFGLWMNLPILPLVLFCPWLLFWAYVGSLVLFNQLLTDEPVLDGEDRPRTASWLARAYDRADTEDRVLRTPFFSLPLPFGAR
ncbi:MAG: DUF4013 domain-containing protein [Planctomycetota bacterium]